jgi:hypothetical protein
MLLIAAGETWDSDQKPERSRFQRNARIDAALPVAGLKA